MFLSNLPSSDTRRRPLWVLLPWLLALLACATCGTGAFAQVPTAPTGLAAVGGNRQATLSWNAVAGATTYNVKGSLTSGGPYQLLGNTPYIRDIVSGLTNGQPSYYVISALNGTQEGPNCPQVAVTPMSCTGPATPTGLSAVGGNQQATLSWNAVPGVGYYNLKYYNGSSYVTLVSTADTAAIVTGMTNGTAYSFEVSSVTTCQESANSAPVSVTPAICTGPATPTGLSAAGGNGRATLTWNTVAGSGVRYNVYAATASAGPYTLLGSTAANPVLEPYVVSGLTNGTPYYFEVSSYTTCQESALSAPVSATPASCTGPTPPTSLTAVGGNGRATLTWNTVTGVTQYNIYVGSAHGGPYTLLGGGTTVAGQSSVQVTLTGLTNGKTYYYVLTSLTNCSESGFSNEAAATPATCTAPSAPTGLTATPGNGQATLTWNAVSGAAGYNIKIANASAGPYTLLGSVTATTTAVTGLTNGTPYYFEVSSYTTCNEGANAGPVSATPAAPPTITTAASASPSPVTAKTATLSVLGHDPQGEALTYTWATTGTPPAPVTFSANGTGASSTTTATFSKAGSYNFVVTAQDTSGQAAASSVTVTVSQTPTSLSVSPASAALHLNGTQAFTATVLDQFGASVAAPAVAWAVTPAGGGAASPASGAATTYTAPAAVPSGAVTVTATSGTASGAATVTVTNAAPTVAAAASATPNPVTGKTAALSVLGADDGGEANLIYTWSGPAGVSFSASGTNAAKNTTATFSKAGSYGLTVTVRDGGGLTASSAVTVVVQQAASSVSVSPASATVAPGGTVQFSATVNDQFGNALATQPVVSWHSLDTATFVPTSGSPTTYTAPPTAGTDTVTATSGSTTSAMATVTIAVPPTNLIAVPTGSGKLTLYWNGVPGASSYNIYYSTTDGGPYTQITAAVAVDPGPGLANAFISSVAGLTNGTEYFFYVAAVNASGSAGTPSNYASASPSADAVAWDSGNAALIVSQINASVINDMEPDDDGSGGTIPQEVGILTVSGPDGVLYQGNYPDGSSAQAFAPSGYYDDTSGTIVDNTEGLVLPAPPNNDDNGGFATSNATVAGPAVSASMIRPNASPNPFQTAYPATPPSGIFRLVEAQPGAWGLAATVGLPNANDPNQVQLSTYIGGDGKPYSDTAYIYSGGGVYFPASTPPPAKPGVTFNVDAGLQLTQYYCSNTQWEPFILPKAKTSFMLTARTKLPNGGGWGAYLSGEVRMQFLSPNFTSISRFGSNTVALHFSIPVNGLNTGVIQVKKLHFNLHACPTVLNTYPVNYLTMVYCGIPGWTNHPHFLPGGPIGNNVFVLKRTNAIAQILNYYGYSGGPSPHPFAPNANAPVATPSGAGFRLDGSYVQGYWPNGAYWGNSGDQTGVELNEGNGWLSWTDSYTLSAGAFPLGTIHVQWLTQNQFFWEENISLLQ